MNETIKKMISHGTKRVCTRCNKEWYEDGYVPKCFACGCNEIMVQRWNDMVLERNGIEVQENELGK